MRFIYTKSFIFFAACLGIVFIFVLFQSKGWIYPIQAAFLNSPRPMIYLTKKITSPVKNFFSTIYKLNKITDENAGLEDKVKKLEQDLVNYEKEKKENETLRKELGFLQSSKLHLVACSVISQNIFGSSEMVAINCGKDDGILEGQAIVSQGFLVGKVIYAGKDSSTALLAVGSQFSIDAKLAKSGTDAIAKGSFGSGMVLDQLPQNTNFEKGSLVVTGGINEKIPKDLLIGEVGEEVSNPNDLFKKMTLLSPIDFNNLEFVFAVKSQ
jgi:rod shape-determining protein MreC